MKLFLICFILVFTLSAHAQDNPALRLHLQSYGIVNPGLEVAWEYPLFSHALTNKKERVQVF